MTINYTTLLGLATPVTGTEANTWGTIVNEQITELLEQAVAGYAEVDVTAANVTLTDVQGVLSSGRAAILLISGTPAVPRNVVLPERSKVYAIVNSSNAAVTLKGSSTTGVTFDAGSIGFVMWDGSDYIRVENPAFVKGPASSTNNTVARFDGTTGKIIQGSTVSIGDDGELGVSVNTTTPAVLITQQGTGDALKVQDSSSPDLTPFVINSAGNVGIGTGTLSGSDTARWVGAYGTSSTTLQLDQGGANIVELRAGVDSNALVTTTDTDLYIGTNNVPDQIKVNADGSVRFNKAIFEKKTAIGASNIDLSVGNYFTKTISGNTVFTVSNAPVSGEVSTFILEITNGGSATVTWFSGVTWAYGVAPVLSSSGTDVLAFYTYDGGTTWRGFSVGTGME